MTKSERIAFVERMTSGNGADCTDMSFVDWPAKLFSGKTIRGVCFYQQAGPDTPVFPLGMKDVTFRCCNLDCVLIPKGNKVVTDPASPNYSCTKRIMCQPLTPKAKHDDADYQEGAVDWVVDKNNKPVEPMDKRRFVDEGRSLKPGDIPLEHVIEVEMTKAEYDKLTKTDWETEAMLGNKPLLGGHQWFKEVPLVISDDGETVVVRGNAWLKRSKKKTDIRPRVGVA